MIDARSSGLLGARRRWGPPVRHNLRDLPAPERAAVADLLTRVRIERARQGLPATISDRGALAAIAAVLSEKKTGSEISRPEPVAPEVCRAGQPEAS
jgi:hypothetical protein